MFDDTEVYDIDVLEVKPYHILGDQAVNDMLDDPSFDYNRLEAEYFNLLYSY